MPGQQEFGSTANSYAILAKLATGGMAEIFLARNASAAGIERYVVLKRVLSHKANDATFVHMFLDEARLAAQLQHPNIAQVYDTGVLGDSYFFTMEYVHGETVRELLHRTYAAGVQIPIGIVLTVIAAAAAGLHHAHERIGMDGKPLGIVHRDVSPSNLMISFEGNVKIVDFGVAKATHRRTETQAGTVKGKIAYLSPEQCRGRVIDRRSDLFSLGIVMWEMLAGTRLFNQGTDYETMEAIVHDTAPSVATKRAGVPPEVDAIVAKLLSRDATKRYQTADELLEAIETVAVKVGVSLSSSSLSRFVRELFGARPEPWIEMQAKDQRAEIVTVTAAPVVGEPEEYELSIDDALDSQLARLPSAYGTVTRTPTPLPFRAATADLAATSPDSASYTEYPSTGSYSSVDSSPSLPARRRSRAVVFGVAGVAIAAGLGVMFVMQSNAEQAPTPAPAPAAVQAAPSPRVEPIPPPAAAPVEPVKVEPPPPADPEPAQPEPSEHVKEPVKRKPEPTKPKVEPTRPKVDKPKADKPKVDKPVPKDDCDVDPMSCRR